jgi:hypothetical protein
MSCQHSKVDFLFDISTLAPFVNMQRTNIVSHENTLGGQPILLHHYVGIHKPSAPLALGKPILSMMVVKRRRRLMSAGSPSC